MLDPFLLRNKLKEIAQQLKKRNFILDEKKFLSLEKKRKFLQLQIEKLQSEYKKNKNLQAPEKYLLKQKIKKFNTEILFLKKEIHHYLSFIPNLAAKNVPIGNNDSENSIISYWGKKREMNFKIQNHIELGKEKKRIDFSSGAKITGSRFVVLRGKIALLHRALSQFMIDLHTTKHGYEETIVPYVVNQESLYGTGQIPKFSKELFHINFLKNNKKNQYSLIPTSEVPLTNLAKNVIFRECDLPIKMVSCTPCFRAEAGSYGKNTQGLIRMHQFDKIELVQIVHPNFSMNALDEIVNHAEKVLQLLNLPYRKVLLCTGVMSFASAKTYDLEVWLPSHNNYREISSCSNMKDFQSRRIKSRYRNQTNKKVELVHTLNGSGLAVGRTLVAVLENYQEKDGSISIPKVLHPYIKLKKIR